MMAVLGSNESGVWKLFMTSRILSATMSVNLSMSFSGIWLMSVTVSKMASSKKSVSMPTPTMTGFSSFGHWNAVESYDMKPKSHFRASQSVSLSAFSNKASMHFPLTDKSPR